MSQIPSCDICGKPQPGWDPVHCCKGGECACSGIPINPCICGATCMAALAASSKPYDQRRKDAGIPRWGGKKAT